MPVMQIVRGRPRPRATANLREIKQSVNLPGRPLARPARLVQSGRC